MTVTEKKLTSVDCIVRWLTYKVRFGAKNVDSHEIQGAGTWVRQHCGLQFNPETLSRAFRHAKDDTPPRIEVKEVPKRGPETRWEILVIDGASREDVRQSKFPQAELFDNYEEGGD